MNLSIDGIEKLITILGFFLIFCGTLKVYTYYKTFGLAITPYLKFTEVLTLFFENLFAFLLVAIFVTLVALDFFYKIRIEDLGASHITELTVFERTIFYIKEMKISHWFLAISAAGYFLLYKTRTNIKFYEFVLSLFMFVIGYYLVPILSVEFKLLLIDWYTLHVNVIYIYFVFLLISLTLFSVAMGLSESRKVKKHDFFINTVFELENENSIKSDRKRYYIGRTEDFIFFYDTLTQRPIVYPASKLIKNHNGSKF
jgi:hypothetical protein